MPTAPDGYQPAGQHPAYQLARDILQLVILVLTMYATTVSSKNTERIESVGQKQEAAAEKTTAVKDQLEARQAEEARALGVQLYSTWKYLEDVAAASGSVRDSLKAAEAKKLYQDHIAKYKPPQ